MFAHKPEKNTLTNWESFNYQVWREISHYPFNSNYQHQTYISTHYREVLWRHQKKCNQFILKLLLTESLTKRCCQSPISKYFQHSTFHLPAHKSAGCLAVGSAPLRGQSPGVILTGQDDLALLSEFYLSLNKHCSEAGSWPSQS